MQFPAQSPQLWRILGTASVALALCALPSWALAQETLADLSQDMEAVRAGLAKYQDYYQSEADFYMAIGCIFYGDIDGHEGQMFGEIPGQMTMWSYPNMMDDKLDPEKPEALIYGQDSNGEYQLAAAVWMHTAGPNTERPTLFGREFEGPVKAEKATPLQQVKFVMYDLHAWLWKENPDGVFTRTNPTLPCVFDSYEIRAEPAPFPAKARITLP
jgi:hypothetical protein